MSLLDKLADAFDQNGGCSLSADEVHELLDILSEDVVDLDMEAADLGDVAFHMDGKKAN